MKYTLNQGSWSLSFGNVTLRDLCAVCVWRYPGEEWQVEKQTFSDAAETKDGLTFTYRFAPLDATVNAVFEENEVRFSGAITHRGGKAVELARFHVFEGAIAADYSFRAYQSVTGSTVVYTNADELKPFRIHHEDMWHSWAEHWLRLPEPYHDAPNWAVAGDIGHFFNKKDEFSIGFYAPGTAAGEIGYRTRCEGDSAVYACVLLDNILFEAGEERVLEKCAVIHRTGNDAFDRWADLCCEMKQPRPAKPLLGYLTWYQGFASITEDQYVNAIREFKPFTAVNLPVVNELDDGFQLMPGVFDVPNRKFEKTFRDLPRLCEENGQIPGLWLAPLPIWCKHPFVTEHPDMIQHEADGTYPVNFCNWSWCDPSVDDGHGPTYFLDPGHPEVKKHIYKMVKDAVDAGWKYLKIDFTYCISERRVAYDRKHTVFEQHRDIWRIAREAAGEDIIICACICGLFRHAIGYADTQRIGGDVTADVASFKRSLPDCITRASTGGKWWTADTDVFYMREIQGLGLEQRWIWTGTVGAIGSVYLTSDYPSQWTDEELERIRYYWRDNGVAPPERIKTVQAEDNSITAVYVKNKYLERVLVYNWSDADAVIDCDISSFGLGDRQPTGRFPADYTVTYKNGHLTCDKLKPFSMRIIEF